MAKTLIAVVNCRTRQGSWADAIRRTWLPMVPKDRADVLFFVGRGDSSETFPEDTVVLDCDDSYQGLPDKIREIVRWAYKRGYEHVLKCDDDVVLNPYKLLDSGFQNHKYSGRKNRTPTSAVPFWVPMGFNYWMSREAMSHLLDAPLPSEGNDDEKWVAQNLHAAGIELEDNQGYRLFYGELILKPTNVVRTIFRPLKAHLNQDMGPDTFAWCIFLEGNSGNVISTQVKLNEFHRVFADHVISNKN